VLDWLEQEYKARPFDGLAYDEEYGSGFRTGNIGGVLKAMTGYPSDYPGVNEAQGWARSAANLLRFAHEANVKIFGDPYEKNDEGVWTYKSRDLPEAERGYDWFENEKFAPREGWDYDAWDWNNNLTRRKEIQAAMEQTKHRLIFEAYEIRAGGWIPESYTYPTDPNDTSYDPRWPGLTIYRKNLIDRSYNSSYGGFGGSSIMERHRFGPASLDLGFNKINPKPPIKDGGGSGIIPRMNEFYKGNYGVIMFYCMTSRAYTIRTHGDDYFGPNQTPVEDYLSDITNILFSTEDKIVSVTYSGRDYDGDSSGTYD